MHSIPLDRNIPHGRIGTLMIELALKIKGQSTVKTVRIQTGKDFTPDARIMLAARLAHDCDMHVFKGLYIPASVLNGVVTKGHYS